MKGRVFICLCTGVLLLLLPLLVTSGMQHALIHAMILALFAASFNLASGSGGMLSFGHSVYFGFGAFATLHLMRAVEGNLIWFPTPLLPLAGAIAGVCAGFLVGLFATLRTGVYFSMLTLAFSELFYQMAPNLAGIFGGETGLSSVRMPFASISFASDAEVYYLVLAWTVVSLLLLWLYLKTPFGRLTLAMRENDERPRFLGFNRHMTKTVIFTVSCAGAGIAGGLFAVLNESANYELFSLTYSANVILFTFIGGANLFLGPPIGAALLTLLGYSLVNVTHLWLLYQGILFVVLMMFFPDGIGGLVIRATERFREGRMSQTVGIVVRVGIPALSLFAALVFVCEAASVILSREYAVRRLAPGGQSLNALFLGAAWDPFALSTWLVPIGLLGLFCATLPFALRNIGTSRGHDDPNRA